MSDALAPGFELLGKYLGFNHGGPKPCTDIVLQAFEPVDAVVENFHAGTHRQSGTRRIFPHNSRTDDDDLGGGNSADASHQQPLAVVRAVEILSGYEHHRTAGDFAHAPYYGVVSAVIFQILETERGDSLVHHPPQYLLFHHRKVDG